MARQPRVAPRHLGYAIVVSPLSDEDGGGYLAEVPDLPGCMGDGDTPAVAIADAEQAIAEWIAEAKRLKRPIPTPASPGQHSGRWVQRVPRSLHGRLAAVAKREGVSLNALVTAILAEGLGQRSGRDRATKAVSELKRLRKRTTLRGESAKELRDTGRR